MLNWFGNYLTQVPSLIWVRVPDWLLVCVPFAANAATDRDSATRAAVTVIMSFFIGDSPLWFNCLIYSTHCAKERILFN